MTQPLIFAYVTALSFYIRAAGIGLAVCLMVAVPPFTRTGAKCVAGGIIGSFPGVLVFQLLTVPVLGAMWLLFWCASQVTGRLEGAAQIVWNIAVIASFLGVFAFGSVLGFIVGWGVGARIAAGTPVPDALRASRTARYLWAKAGAGGSRRRSTPSTTRGHFIYGRHFSLLILFAAAAAGIGQWGHLSEPFISFALFGTFHASALAAALRSRQAIWRRCLFVAIAALLSVAALWVGLLGAAISAKLPGSHGSFALIGLSSALGAAAYGILTRIFWIPELTSGSLAMISVGCVLAAFAGLFTRGYSQFFGAWWLAVLWWLAFSGGLWYYDCRRSATARSGA